MTLARLIIPRAILDALDDGRISPEQFDIFCYGYLKAERPEYRVRSYSAACVCRFRWLDATPANIKRYERAALDLWKRHLVHRDYYQIDPTRSDKKGRTYSIWLPAPPRFQVVATPEENQCSLWRADVGLLVHDNVGVQTDGTPRDSRVSNEEEPDNVGVDVGLDAHQLSITYQEAQNPKKKSPLNPPRDFSPSAPAGGAAQTPPGLGKTTGIRKSLDANQCALLNEAALRYASLTDWIYNFVPDPKTITNLLRVFSPAELWCAQITKFPPLSKFGKNNMAHFFATGAKTLITAARLNGTSYVRRGETMQELTKVRPDFSRRWCVVCDAWDAIGLTVADGLAYIADEVDEDYNADEVDEANGVKREEK
jgi:hypothetical protein